MAIQLLLEEADQLHRVSARLEGLADEHTSVTSELLTIASSVRSAATLLSVLVQTKLQRSPG